MKTVLIPHDIAEEGKDFLRERGYLVKLGRGSDKSSLLLDVPDADAILFRNEAYDAEVLQAAKKLKVMSRHGVGVDKVDLKAAEELGIWVTNGPTSNSNTVAEMALGTIIALGRNLVASNRATHSLDFEFRNRTIGIDLQGKTLALIGLGKIGLLLAQKAHYGLGMKVVAFDFRKDAKSFPSYVRRLESFDDAFREGDFVSIHYPSNGNNDRTITLKQFKLMKKSAYFINLARGELLVEKDLVEALSSSLIAGAALDVYDHEPPHENNPLLALENVLLTPHNASLTTDCMVRMALHAAQGIDEVLSGKEPTWPVNHPGNPRK
ncbi:hydroxyacid dehydrogenase [Oceanispirochaeta crateris]|uniref:Hydroxyacid dehydrogenase n=1 Tax=Oceanispirochaeta crateris TaxID=2518645 RepID=A0A5C1QS61_9SPIO|nr:hydroxyacid dehydrogenase [Oceanispirochaeta crateris]QEN09474.1 hydroxyacid dehydrogenase [Oceanispirochaeta crateris]